MTSSVPAVDADSFMEGRLLTFSPQPTETHLVLPTTYLRVGWLTHAFLSNEGPEPSHERVIHQQIAHARLYPQKLQPGIRSRLPGETALVHYLLARYGLQGAADRYLGPKTLLAAEHYATLLELEPNPRQVALMRSCGQLPVPPTEPRAYGPTTHALLFDRARLNAKVHAFTAGVFYALDLFGDELEEEQLDDPRLWQEMLGCLIPTDTNARPLTLDEVVLHLQNLAALLDESSLTLLREELHIPAEDLFDVLAHVTLRGSLYTTDPLSTP